MISFPSKGKSRRFSLSVRGKMSRFSRRHFRGKKSAKTEFFRGKEKPIYYVYSFFPFPPVRGEVVVRQLTHDDSFPCPDKANFFLRKENVI
nr:MAG TPA: hypothetical protein [Caudoviricetes sp.]